MTKKFFRRGRKQTQFIIGFRKWQELSELAKLRTKRAAEMFAVCCIERAVAESVVSVFKCNDAAFARGQQRGFQRGFHGFKAGVGENNLSGFWILDFGLRI